MVTPPSTSARPSTRRRLRGCGWATRIPKTSAHTSTHSGSTAIRLVAHVLHPLDRLAVERLVDRDVLHGCGGRRAVPLRLVRLEEDGVTRLHLLDGLPVALNPTAPEGDDDRLPVNQSAGHFIEGVEPARAIFMVVLLYRRKFVLCRLVEGPRRPVLLPSWLVSPGLHRIDAACACRRFGDGARHASTLAGKAWAAMLTAAHAPCSPACAWGGLRKRRERQARGCLRCSGMSRLPRTRRIRVRLRSPRSRCQAE